MKIRILAILVILLVVILMPAGVVLASGTSVTVTPSSATVSPGGTFTVDLVINNDVPVYAWQGQVNFDASKLTCSAVTEGNFLKSNGSTVSGAASSIDNTAGTVSNLDYSLTGINPAAVGSNGILATLSFTAKTGVSGTANITLVNMQVAQFVNNDTSWIQNVTANSGSITITSIATTTTTSTTTTSTTTTTTPATWGTTTSTVTTTTPTTTVTSTSSTTTTPTTTIAYTTATTNSTTKTTTTPTKDATTTGATTTATQLATESTTATTVRKTTSNLQSTTGANNSIDLTNIIDTNGILQGNMQKMNISYGGNVPIYDMEIASGTRALDSTGEPLETITVQPSTSQLLPPSGETIISAVDFGPTGTTFSKPISITFQYDTTQLPQGVNMKSLSLTYYNPQQSKWEDCDYVLDSQNHRITAMISHFSTYAVLGKGGVVVGFGWSMAGLIIVLELAAGAAAVYLFMHRSKPVTPVIVTAEQVSGHQASLNQRSATARMTLSSSPVSGQTENADVNQPTADGNNVAWEEILKESIKRKEKYRAQVEIIGGRIIIPGNGKTSDIEIISTPGSRVMISLEYDPDANPQNVAKIIVPGKVTEYEKAKEK